MTSNVIDQPAKANEDRLNMKAYADALTEFIASTKELWLAVPYKFYKTV